MSSYTLFSGDIQGAIISWDDRDVGEPVKREQSSSSGPIQCMQLSHDKSLLLVGTATGLDGYNTDGDPSNMLHSLTNKEARVFGVDFLETDPSLCVFGSSKGYIKTFDLRAQRQVSVASKSSSRHSFTCLSAMGDTLFVGDDEGHIHFYNLSDLSIQQKSQRISSRPIYSIDTYANMMTAVDDKGQIFLWRDDRVLQIAPQSVYFGNKCRFSPDGRHIVVSTSEGALIYGVPDNFDDLSDADTQYEVMLGNHSDWVLDALFSADGRSVVTACGDTTIRVFDLEKQRLRAAATGGDKPNAHSKHAAHFSEGGNDADGDVDTHHDVADTDSDGEDRRLLMPTKELRVHSSGVTAIALKE